MIRFRYILLSIVLLIGISIVSATDPIWISDTVRVTGLDDCGAVSTPSVFQYNNSWWVIIGDQAPADNNPPQLNGSIWNASSQSWEANATIVNNLMGDLGLNYDLAPSVFVRDGGVLSAVVGMQGMLRFHEFNGSAWNRNATHEAGWSYGAYNYPSVYYNLTGVLCLLVGHNDGTIDGFSWNGTSWNPDNSVNNSLPDVGSYAAPSVINSGDILYLIVGEQSAELNGYYRTGSAWVSDSGLVNGLSAEAYMKPALYNSSGYLSVLIGKENGLFDAYYYDSMEPPAPHLVSPVNGSEYTTKSITLETGHFNETGLIGWWSFNGNYNDSSDENNDGTPSGGTGFTFGIDNSSMSLDGVDGYVNCGDMGVGGVGSEYSFSLWVKQSVEEDSELISSGISSTYPYTLRIDDENKFRVASYDGSNNPSIQGDTTIIPYTWYHVAAVFDRSTVTVYVNGDSWSTADTTSGDISNGLDLNIGRRTGGGLNFDGLIDEVLFFERALTSSDVELLYSYGLEEDESLQSYFYGDTTDGSTPLGTSLDGNYSWTLATTGTYHWKSRVYDGNYYGDYSVLNDFYAIFAPNLSNPANESTEYYNYPPLFEDVSFNWENIAAPAYQIQVAQDVNFNLISSDTTTSLPSATVALGADQYWWRVRSYNTSTSTYSDWSSVFNFNLVANGSVENNSVQGVVYENVGGVNSALSNAKVVIWNATFTDSMTTGSNGYYLFTGLATGETYYLQASKDLYLTSEEVIINATVAPITKNFYLLPDRTSEEWRHYVKFVLMTIWGQKFPNVAVSVYENSGVTATTTGTTGADGSVAFVMNRQQQYRITFINATQGISETRTLYPKDEHYYIIVSSNLGSWDSYDTQINDAIDFDISTNEINSTHAYINVSYLDTENGTQSLTVYLNTTNSSDYINQTNLDTWNAGATNNSSHSFVVSDYGGQGYFIHLLVTHDDYGTIDSVYSVGFDDNIALQFPNIPQSVFLYVAVFLLIFSAGIFTVTTVPAGMLILTIENFMYIGLGCYQSLPSGVQTSITAGTILAFILAIIANLNESSKKEGYK